MNQHDGAWLIQQLTRHVWMSQWRQRWKSVSGVCLRTQQKDLQLRTCYGICSLLLKFRMHGILRAVKGLQSHLHGHQACTFPFINCNIQVLMLLHIPGNKSFDINTHLISYKLSSKCWISALRSWLYIVPNGLKQKIWNAGHAVRGLATIVPEHFLSLLPLSFHISFVTNSHKVTVEENNFQRDQKLAVPCYVEHLASSPPWLDPDISWTTDQWLQVMYPSRIV